MEAAVQNWKNDECVMEGPAIRALIAAAVPWLVRAMADEARPLIGHTSLSAAAAAVRTPLPLP